MRRKRNFFPADAVIPRAKEIIPNLVAAESLKGSNHFPSKQTIDIVNKRIKEFLVDFKIYLKLYSKNQESL